LKTTQARTQGDLDGTVRLFKDLGRSQQATELVERFMAEKKAPREFFDLSEYAFAGEIKDPDVIEAFSAKVATFKDERDPIAVLKNIARQKAWHEDDIRLVAKLTPDDFRAF
jgi:hypothetical protein